MESEKHYHPAEDDHNYGSFVFELIKTVITVIDSGTFLSMRPEWRENSLLCNFVDDRRFRFFLSLEHGTDMRSCGCALDNSLYIADRTWTTFFCSCVMRFLFLRWSQMLLAQCDFLRSAPNDKVVGISDTCK